MFKTIAIIFAALIGLSSPALARSFPADVYPSRTTAIRQLVEQVIHDWSEDPKFDAKNISAQFTAAGIPQSDLDALVIAPMKQAFPEMKIGPADHNWYMIVLSATEKTITLTVNTKIYSANFVDKPWADDWQLFINKDSKHRWLRGTSPTPGASESEAIMSARLAAKESLMTLVQTELNARGAKLAELKSKMTPDWLEQRVSASLQMTRNDGKVVVDTFIQKFPRPYGDVYQASVLVNASPKIIGELADSYTNRAHQDFGTKAAGAIAVVGLAAVLGLLYAFTNAVTKGYFMWRLRAVAFLAAIAGILIVFAVV